MKLTATIFVWSVFYWLIINVLDPLAQSPLFGLSALIFCCAGLAYTVAIWCIPSRALEDKEQ